MLQYSLVLLCSLGLAGDATQPEDVPTLLKRAEELAAKKQYAQALQLGNTALAAARKTHGKEHALTAQALHFLGLQSHRLGKTAAARKLTEEALTIRLKVLGPAADTAQTLHNLGVLAYELREDAASQNYYEQAVAMRRKVLGAMHLTVAYSLEGLGKAHTAQRAVGPARACYEEALAIRRKALGDGHATVLQALQDLGLFLSIQARDLPAAQASYELLLALRQQHSGADHLETARAHDLLAQVLEQRKDTAAAIRHYEAALPIRRKALSPTHPDLPFVLDLLADRLLSLKEYDRAKALYTEALQWRVRHLGEYHREVARSLDDLAQLHERQNDRAAARRYSDAAVAVMRKAVGTEHLLTASALVKQGSRLQLHADYAAARPLFEEALAIRRKLLHEADPQVLSALGSLAQLMQAQRDLAAAARLYDEIDALRKKTLPTAPTTPAQMEQLARYHESRNERTAARQWYTQALEQRVKTQGPQHVDVGKAMARLGGLLFSEGQWAEARTHYERALAILLAALGEEHPEIASTRGGLAGILAMQRDFAGARVQLQQVLASRRKHLGADNPATLITQQELAFLAQRQGDLAAARAGFEQLLAYYEKAGNDTMIATCLGQLTVILEKQQDLPAARRLAERTLALTRKSWGKDHPFVADSLVSLAGLHTRQGELAGARECYDEALTLLLHSLDSAAAGQSERQQLLYSRSYRNALDRLLALPAGDAAEHAHVYGHLLAWKGQVFARQQLARFDRTDPATTGLLDELQHTSSKLAALLQPPPADQRATWLEQRAALASRREALERQLAAKSQAFQRDLAVRRPTLAQLQSALPADAVLVEFQIYPSGKILEAPDGKLTTEHVLGAFVIRKQGKVSRLDLGSIEPIEAAIAQWRKQIGAGVTADTAGAELRRRLWLPLVEQVRDSKLILLAPDGALGKLPFHALPGSKPGSYLLEEHALVVTPAPRLLFGAAARVAAPNDTEALLIVGDVDFAAGAEETSAASHAAVRATGKFTFAPLPGTQAEMEGIVRTYRGRFADGRLTKLAGRHANEAAIRQAAMASRWLHFATHGYFAPAPQDGSAQAREEEAGQHPGLLCGLACAGANQPPQPQRDDGILTALEVADLDLRRVSTVVLSACESGLGKTADGEGVLSLQRAFQLAGARTVVGSLWSIPDEPTQVLMERFYDNLWSRKLGQYEALREAQLWMLREGRSHAGVQRGVERVKAPVLPKDGRLPPYYWAAFVLSGDWR